MDLAQASDIVTDVMSMYQLEAEEAGRATDVFAKTSTSTNTDVNQLGKAFEYVGANANDAGMSIETTSAFLGLLADNGIKGSKAGTTLNAMLRDMKKNAEDGTFQIGEQTVALYDSNGEMRDMTDVVDDLIKGTSKMSDEQRDQALSSVFGTEALKGFNIIAGEGEGATKDLTKELENSDGAAENMAETMQDNAKGQLQQFKSALEDMSISLSEHLLPSVTSIIEKLTEWVRKFGELSPATQKTIISIAGITAVIGPMALAFGGAFKAISLFSGGIAKAIGWFGRMSMGSKTAKTSMGLFGKSATKTGTTTLAAGKSFGKAAGTLGKIGRVAGVARGALSLLGGPMGLLATVGIPALIKGGKKLYDHLTEDSIPAVEGFGDKVSESTEKTVLGYKKLHDDATTQLNELFWGGQEITEEGSKGLIETFKEMGNQISESMEESFNDSYETLSKFMKDSKEVSKEERKEILESMQEGHEEQKENLKEHEGRIKEILEQASTEKRELTEKEKEEINKIQDKMMETAVQTMSDGEVEQTAIMETLENNASEITARQAAETVKNSKKAKNGTVKEANEKYDKTVAAIIRERDETGSISAEQAKKLIEETERQRSGSVNKAKNQHKNVVKHAKEQARENA